MVTIFQMNQVALVVLCVAATLFNKKVINNLRRDELKRRYRGDDREKEKDRLKEKQTFLFPSLSNARHEI